MDGYTSGESKISDSKNEGNVSGTYNTSWVAVGGIIGFISENSKCVINSCYNSGTLKTVQQGTGGIVGWFGGNSNQSLSVTQCYNIGVFPSGSLRAALVGRGGGPMHIDFSYFLVGPACYYDGAVAGAGGGGSCADMSAEKMCEKLGEKFKFKDTNGVIFDYPKLFWE